MSDQPVVSEASQIDLSTVKCGYIVAVKEDGEFLFEPIGTDIGLVQMLGIHKFAGSKIEQPLIELPLEKIIQSQNTILKVLAHIISQSKKPAPELPTPLTEEKK